MFHTSTLLRVDAHPIISDDGARRRRYPKLLRGKLKYRCERRFFRHVYSINYYHSFHSSVGEAQDRSGTFRACKLESISRAFRLLGEVCQWSCCDLHFEGQLRVRRQHYLESHFAAVCHCVGSVTGTSLLFLAVLWRCLKAFCRKWALVR